MSMLQMVPQRQHQAVTDDCDSPSATDSLLRFVGPLEDAHVLLVTADGPELLCKLLRQGCASVTSLRASFRPERAAYDLVVIPQVAKPADIGQLIYCARRALVPTGRFITTIPMAMSGSNGDITGLLVRSLRMGGFAPPRSRPSKDGLIVRADLPMYGLSSALPRLARG